MFSSIKSRHTITIAVIFFYLMPMVVLSSYGINITSPQKSLNFFALGLLLAAVGTFSITFLMNNWKNSLLANENTLQHTSTISEPLHYENVPLKIDSQGEISKEEYIALEQKSSEAFLKNELLLSEVSKKNIEIQKLCEDINFFKSQFDNCSQEHESLKKKSQQESNQKQKHIDESLIKINDLEGNIRINQSKIEEMVTKINDLKYEIKTLLHLNEMNTPEPLTPLVYAKDQPKNDVMIRESFSNYQVDTESLKDKFINYNFDNPVTNPEDGALYLRRCLDIAQKITGANHFSINTSKYRDLSVDNYALDLRRLFDSLRSENSCGVIVYSQKENKLLFANNQTKNLSGWGPEKFVQNFSEITQTGIHEWKSGLNQLTCKKESSFRLLIKTKSGQDVPFHCHLGIISTGLFRNHIIGVLY